MSAQTEKKRDKGEKEREKRKRAKSDPKKPPLREVKRSSFLKSATSGSVATVFKDQLNEYPRPSTYTFFV